MNDALGRLATALSDRYRIERELGAGGMATVYLAEDLKHKRKVAVKVLKPELAAALGPDRFVREIEVAARLHHPHILPLYDSGEADGFLFYVMPYEAGQSLRERLQREAELPIRDVVRLLHDVADALSHAHQHGLVHRDIKPENVMLSGRHALVTDFGVAKAVSDATGRHNLTSMGVALGTPAYMAPEQAAADPHVDHRADIYALGVLGYELLTGHPPFGGQSPQAVLAAHVTQTPVPVSQHRPSVPPALAALIMRCLEKKAADRFQSAAELVPLLELQLSPSGGTTPVQTAAHQSVPVPVGRRPAFLVGTVLLAGILVGAAVYAVSLTRTRRTVAVAEQRQITFTGDAYQPAISPDGKWLAYVSGDSALLVQEVSGGRAVAVLNASQFREPVWSPDGTNLLIGAELGDEIGRDGLFEIPRLGGEPKRVGSNAYAYDYSPDGRRIAWVVFDTLGITDRKSGNELRRLEVPGVSVIRRVKWSPDGRWLALGGSLALGGPSIFLMDSTGPAIHVISRKQGPLAWNASGTALYILNESRIIRQAIDRRAAVPQDTGETVLPGLSDVSSFSLSREGGTLVLARGPSSGRNLSLMVPSSGRALGVEPVVLSSGTGRVGPPVISPDGRLVAWSQVAGRTEIILLAASTGGVPRTIARYEGMHGSDLRWEPDGRRLAWFVSDSSQSYLYTVTTDGGPPIRVAAFPVGAEAAPRSATYQTTWSWARQGLIMLTSATRGYQLVDPSSGRAAPLASTDSLTRLYMPLISPDGKTLIAARWRPFGFNNDLWQGRLDTGRWERLPDSVTGGDPAPLRWDGSGISIAVRFYDLRDATFEIWRAPTPGAPFRPLVTGLRWCTGVPSISNDAKHVACTQSTFTSDIWLASGFDATR